MAAIKQILLKYWGYPAFRPLQEDIINSVLHGTDTLALLPTGGGKSVCFQVPAMAMEGICLVITPLIALMKDQVEGLKKKGIKAGAIHSGQHKQETAILIDNCVFGEIKFLYVSPERLESRDFLDALRNMKLCLLAVDEAHCVSQWGYDFRPPYLNIASVRPYFPGVPVMALTATATPQVVKDIQDKLQFKKYNVIQGSFERRNLAYQVFKVENKFRKILELLENNKGTGIIYVRSRRGTRDIFELLKNNNISADYYHAGLDPKTRSEIQESWMKGTTRIMVSTNAFGMGIDKPNVRVVVHVDLPDSLEAYFQEAGRAGRDGNESLAVLLYDEADVDKLKQNHESSFPELKLIKNIYNSLGNYFQLAVGAGKDMSFDFDMNAFSSYYNYKPILVFNALKILEKEGYLAVSDALLSPSRVYIQQGKEDLYRFQVENPKMDPFIKLLLRSYSGLFSEFIKIDENSLATRSGLEPEKVVKYLDYLDKREIISYLPRKGKPQLLFLKERLDSNDLNLTAENYRYRKIDAGNRMQAVINYVQSGHLCRSQFLLSYFGEKNLNRCGKCDVCLKRENLYPNDMEFDAMMQQIKKTLSTKRLNLMEIIEALPQYDAERLINVIQWLTDNGKLAEENEKLFWKQQYKFDF